MKVDNGVFRGLKVEGLTVELSKTVILEDLDLTVKEGEFFSLLGGSGCGKTTLLKTVAGLTHEKSGTIMLNGRPLHELPPQKRNVVVMFQDIRLFGNMSVGENVAFSLRNHGVSKAECKSRADDLLRRVQLEGFAEKKTTMLSGGQAQRVALARALAAEPELLLLDEPFSALDENLRDSMRSLVLEVHRDLGLTTILVTHDQGEALMMSDRLATMDRGRISQVGTPREVFDSPASLDIATYFSEGEVIEGEVVDGEFRRGPIRIPVDCEDGDYAAVIRPSAFSLSTGNAFFVTDVKYRGEHMTVTIGEGDVSLSYQCPAHESVAVGDGFDVSFDAEKVLLFPKDAAASTILDVQANA